MLTKKQIIKELKELKLLYEELSNVHAEKAEENNSSGSWGCSFAYINAKQDIKELLDKIEAPFKVER